MWLPCIHIQQARRIRSSNYRPSRCIPSLLVRNSLLTSGFGGAKIAVPLWGFDLELEIQQGDGEEEEDKSNDAGDDDDYLGVGVFGGIGKGAAGVEW
jgi:hypothetical protein